MTPQETFNALMQGNKVKLTDDAFKGFLDEFESYQPKPDNDFLINSIEESSVSLYNYNTQEVYYDMDFDCIVLSGDKTETNEVPQNIYLNRLKELYKFAVQNEESEFYIGRLENYQSVRVFCLDTQLVSFNDIELIENEVNTEINKKAKKDSGELDSWGK